MGLIIEDGTGHGYQVGVTKENQMLVQAEQVFSEEKKAQQGDSYILHGVCHLSASTNGGLLYFTNTSSDSNVAITRIYFDAHSLYDDIIITQIKNPATVVNGTDITATGIVNKNYTSGNELEGTLVISDGSSDMTFTDGSQYHSFVLQSLSGIQRDMRGTNILGLNDTIVFGWATVDGANAVDAEEIALSVNLYEFST